VNLGTARIVIIVALVVAGAAVLANGFPESGGSVAGPSGGASPSGSPSSPASSPSFANAAPAASDSLPARSFISLIWKILAGVPPGA